MLLTVFAFARPAFAEEAVPLSEDQIRIRFEQLHDKYKLGDILDDEDAAFVKEYVSITTAGKRAKRSENSFNRSNDAYGLQGSAVMLTRQETMSASVNNSGYVKLDKSMNYVGVTSMHYLNTYLDVETNSNVSYTWSI
ncbi:MAG: hypothetical protein ACOX4F_08230 [Atopobiaceae bacterium]|jgi:hypothetical protein